MNFGHANVCPPPPPPGSQVRSRGDSGGLSCALSSITALRHSSDAHSSTKKDLKPVEGNWRCLSSSAFSKQDYPPPPCWFPFNSTVSQHTGNCMTRLRGVNFLERAARAAAPGEGHGTLVVGLLPPDPVILRPCQRMVRRRREGGLEGGVTFLETS